MDGSLQSASDIQSQYPYIDISTDGPTGLLVHTKAGYLNARQYVKAQLAVARHQGCDVINDVVNRVTEIDQSDSSEGQKRMQIETEGGKRIMAKKVLICTGAFTQYKNLLPKECKLDAMVTTDIAVRFEIDNDCAHRLRDMPCMTSEFQALSPRECYILPPMIYPDGKTS